MKITNEIVGAIRHAVDELGSQRALSELSGVSCKNISKYLNGSIKTIRADAWKKLIPHINQYLTLNDVVTTACLQVNSDSDINKEFALFVQWLKQLPEPEQKKILSIYSPQYSHISPPIYWEKDPDILLVLATHPCLMPGTSERLVREFQAIKDNPVLETTIRLQNKLIERYEEEKQMFIKERSLLEEIVSLQKNLIPGEKSDDLNKENGKL